MVERMVERCAATVVVVARGSARWWRRGRGGGGDGDGGRMEAASLTAVAAMDRAAAAVETWGMHLMRWPSGGGGDASVLRRAAGTAWW